MVYPNPFNREEAAGGTVKFMLPGRADVDIYDIAGYRVYSMEGVIGRIEWDGTNREGGAVVPGVYFYIISTENEKITGKLFIVR